ncbi:MucR family transcriptional regulator [Sphingomonas hengshuiensis]|uniref:MucR family transcriptional regulator n=1 Tax=Sphingomonas hengshuiensis TaxID=1609977 RepID=UPI000695FA33|nr:MucR family transcriptional regulator [Sphingomonas hengshuiensis]
MVAAAANDVPEPIPAGEIVLVGVADVREGERLRPIDPVWAEALGGIMAKEGQQTPIEICAEAGKPGWLLVAGGHRLRGAGMVGMELIEARIVSGSEAHRRMREVTENLWRRELEPIDRAAFLAELVTLHKVSRGIDPTKDGRSASVQVRWQKALKEEAADTTATVAVVYGWSAEVGEQLGLSERTVRNDLYLYRRLAPSLIARLRAVRHPVAGNAAQLKALAKLEPGEQAAVVDMLALVGNDGVPLVKTVSDARARLSGDSAAVDPADKRFATIIGTLKRMGVSERLGLFQSPQFHDLIPAEARQLLAPMLRAGAESDGEENDLGFESARSSSREAGLGRDERSVLAGGADAGRQRHPRGAKGEGTSAHGAPLAGRSSVSAGAADAEVNPLTPAVPIRQSCKPDYMVCLECGEKVQHLSLHLRTAHILTRAEYLVRWKLPLDYPFLAPNYSEARRKAHRANVVRVVAARGAA